MNGNNLLINYNKVNFGKINYSLPNKNSESAETVAEKYFRNLRKTINITLTVPCQKFWQDFLIS